MHKFDTTARRYGAAPADPLGFGRRYSRRACTYLYHFSFSLYYSHPCIRLIHLLHPYNHLTAYLAIAFNLTPSVGRFYFRPYSTRSTRKYAAKRIKYFLNFFPSLKILREILSFRGRYGSIVLAKVNGRKIVLRFAPWRSGLRPSATAENFHILFFYRTGFPCSAFSLYKLLHTMYATILVFPVDFRYPYS